MISFRDLELLKIDISLGRPKNQLRVKINSPELELVYDSLKAEIDEAKAKGFTIDFSNETFENPDFEPMKNLE